MGWVFDHVQAHPRDLSPLSWQQPEGWQSFVGEESQPEPCFGHGLHTFAKAQVAGLLRDTLEPVALAMRVFNLPLVSLSSLPRFHLPEDGQLEQMREQVVG